MPTVTTVMRWLQKHEDFRAQYHEARQVQADTFFDELTDLADEATPETVNVQKLKIWTRQWWMSRIDAKKYGDKSGPDINVSNTVQNITLISEAELSELQRRHQAALSATRKTELQ